MSYYREGKVFVVEEKELIFFTVALLLCGILKDASCELNSAEASFSRKPGTVHKSPHSWPEVTTCKGKPCSHIACAKACVQKEKCTVFSYNPTNSTCIFSWRPDDDPTSYESTDSDWNTYYKVCPVAKGYVLYTRHYPPLCLRADKGPVLFPTAKSTCLAEGTKLVRIKSLKVYDIVKDLLNATGYAGVMGIYIGADDLQQEGQFLWNDGTALPLGSDLWLSASEGYNDHEDCTSVSITQKIWDTTCLLWPRGFVCQFDLYGEGKASEGEEMDTVLTMLAQEK